MQIKTTSASLIVQDRALMILPDSDFEQQTLQWQIRRVSREKNDVEQAMQADLDTVSTVSVILSHANRDLVHVIEYHKAQLRALTGEKDRPLYVPPDPEDTLSNVAKPKPVPEKKRAPRFIEAELKFLFRKISAVTHPDKTRDEILGEFFPIAVEFYKEADLEGLKIIYDSVKEYVSLKKDRKNLKAFFRSRIAETQRELLVLKNKLIEFRQTEYYCMIQAYKQGDHEGAKKIHADLMYKVLQSVKAEIRRLTE